MIRSIRLLGAALGGLIGISLVTRPPPEDVRRLVESVRYPEFAEY